jgi:integrase
MGSIYKRGKVYWIKYYRNGKPYRESTKGNKEADAKRLLKRREGEISQGKLPGIYFDRVRFDELAEDFLNDYRVNDKKSLSAAGNNVNHLKGFFGGMRVTDITTPQIRAYIEYRGIDREMLGELAKEGKNQSEIAEILGVSLANVSRPMRTENETIRAKKGASNATINRELSALKRMLNMAAQQTPPKVDHVPYIPMLKENNTRKGFFEHGEYLALRNALPDYMKGFATFAYKTGWRVSEISHLTWSQVDLGQGIVRLEVGETKNDEGRTVYMDEELKEVLNLQQDLRKQRKTLTPYVFTNEQGADRIKDFRKSWASACKEAGLGKKLFHDFRRTAVRNMVRAGVPERVAMLVSGHKTRSVFERYNIVSDTDLRLAAQKQEEYLKSQMGTFSGTIAVFDTKKEASN